MAKAKTLRLRPDTPGGDVACSFLDGPWAGQRVTYKREVSKFEVGRQREPHEQGDQMFRYEPAAPARESFGLKEVDYKLTYNGPAFVGGRNA